MTIFRRNHHFKQCVAPAVVIEPPILTVVELCEIEGRIGSGWRLKADLDRLVAAVRKSLAKK